MRLSHRKLRVGDADRSIDFCNGVRGRKLLHRQDRDRSNLAIVGCGDEVADPEDCPREPVAGAEAGHGT